MEFLASDALHGRGSGTNDELIAATYAATEMEQCGIEPAGDGGGYLQRVTLIRRTFKSPVLRFTAGESTTTLQHGKEMLVVRATNPILSGPLQKFAQDAAPEDILPGAMLLAAIKPGEGDAQRRIGELLRSRAAAVLVPDQAVFRVFWERSTSDFVAPLEIEGVPPSSRAQPALILLKEAGAAQIAALTDGTPLELTATAGEAQKSLTWNAIGKLPGSDPKLTRQAVLLTAHIDHLGIGRPVDGDEIYNGADDDASGVTAVLELARALSAGRRPRRTVFFALFGSEETGLRGARYFLEHPTVPLADIVANLEFEMIGRSDSTVPPHTLWLTGWERSNLGPALASHGARLVADPHPKENFFQRSDNYALALRGVVAQTVSSYGLHKDYHRPTDDLAHIDFAHMDDAIGSLLKPVSWLVNSDFRPAWAEGKQPK